jgi:hypothetical protein
VLDEFASWETLAIPNVSVSARKISDSSAVIRSGLNGRGYLLFIDADESMQRSRRCERGLRLRRERPTIVRLNC